MNTLLKRAEELDLANGLTDQQQKEKMQQLSDYRRRVAKLNAKLLRHTSNMPTAEDFKRLEAVESAASRW